MERRDGHVRVLPLHVANKIAAGEVVERPASVVKELVENSIDAGARNIKVSVTQGGRKLVSVRDDGCGMTRDDAVLSLERQATSKILDVDDIERIDTLGFRGEAIPSIASVSRFTLVTRRHDADEGTQIVVNAGTLAEVSSAGCPPGTLVEVRDLFCNVPARRKFLRAYATEEGHVKNSFTVHALAHPAIGFSLTIDGRELYRLAPATTLKERILDIFGAEFMENLLPLSNVPDTEDLNTETQRHRGTECSGVSGSVGRAAPCPPPVVVKGFIERPNLSTPTRRDQYVFVNGRPATAASVAYAIREAYPRRQGDAKPALFLFIDLPPEQVDVNVHPTKREVRFRDNVAVKRAITDAIERALGTAPAGTGVFGGAGVTSGTGVTEVASGTGVTGVASGTGVTGVASGTGVTGVARETWVSNVPNVPSHASPVPHAPTRPYSTPPRPYSTLNDPNSTPPRPYSTLIDPNSTPPRPYSTLNDPNSPPPRPYSTLNDPNSTLTDPIPPPQPVAVDLPLAAAEGGAAKPWKWFEFLAQTASGYLLIETDAGLVTVNPQAARERIAFERLRDSAAPASQQLLLPETVQLSPVDAARISAAIEVISSMGFRIEPFGRDTFKIDAVPQLIGSLPPADVISTIAHDLSEGGARRGATWREELIAKSVARSFAGMSLAMDAEGATRLVEDLASCRMPYVSPAGKPTMIFTSTRELDRKFAKS